MFNSKQGPTQLLVYLRASPPPLPHPFPHNILEEAMHNNHHCILPHLPLPQSTSILRHQNDEGTLFCCNNIVGPLLWSNYFYARKWYFCTTSYFVLNLQDHFIDIFSGGDIVVIGMSLKILHELLHWCFGVRIGGRCDGGVGVVVFYINVAFLHEFGSWHWDDTYHKKYSKTITSQFCS